MGRSRMLNYQVEFEDGTTSTVFDLTEKQAKKELCLAMDLIEKLKYNIHNSLNLCEKYKY